MLRGRERERDLACGGTQRPEENVRAPSQSLSTYFGAGSLADPGLVSSCLDGELANPCDPSFSVLPGTGVTGVHETPSLIAGCWVRNSGHNCGASILNC